MVLLLDGNSEHVAHACRKVGLFGEKNPTSESSRVALRMSNNTLLLTCAPISELPLNISTMTQIFQEY